MTFDQVPNGEDEQMNSTTNEVCDISCGGLMSFIISRILESCSMQLMRAASFLLDL